MQRQKPNRVLRLRCAPLRMTPLLVCLRRSCLLVGFNGECRSFGSQARSGSGRDDATFFVGWQKGQEALRGLLAGSVPCWMILLRGRGWGSNLLSDDECGVPTRSSLFLRVLP